MATLIQIKMFKNIYLLFFHVTNCIFIVLHIWIRMHISSEKIDHHDFSYPFCCRLNNPFLSVEGKQ